MAFVLYPMIPTYDLKEVTNYKSTTGDDVCNKVEKAMQEEIQHGNYIITTE